jgi:hypothetical protein
MTAINPEEIVDRYVAVWNERDRDSRRKAVVELWADDGAEFTPMSEIRGHDALDARVTSAHDEFVAKQGFVFALSGPPTSHHDAVKFNVHMAPAAGGDIPWRASIVMLLDDDGRILRDYQFMEA